MLARRARRLRSPLQHTPEPAATSLAPALTAQAGGGPEADFTQSRDRVPRGTALGARLTNGIMSGGRARRVFPTPAGPCGSGDALRGRGAQPPAEGRGRRFSGFRLDKLPPARPESSASVQRGAAVRKKQSLPLSNLLRLRWQAGRADLEKATKASPPRIRVQAALKWWPGGLDCVPDLAV